MRLFLKRLLRRWCPSPESERLLAAMEAAEIELERRKGGQDPGTEKAGWLVAATRNLEKARAHLTDEASTSSRLPKRVAPHSSNTLSTFLPPPQNVSW